MKCVGLSVVDCTRKPSADSDSALPNACEVHNIPPDCTEEKLTMIFENKRFTRVAGATVVGVKFMDKSCSRAIVTFSSPEGYCYDDLVAVNNDT